MVILKQKLVYGGFIMLKIKIYNIIENVKSTMVYIKKNNSLKMHIFTSCSILNFLKKHKIELWN